MFTNIGLVEHVKRALCEKWVYAYGTIGQVLTEAILKQKQVQYPQQINKHLALLKTYIGRRSVDCVNLIKSYLWWDKEKDDPAYSGKYDLVDGVSVNANGMFYLAKEKGLLKDMPDLVGLCVWRPGHIGVYIGDGQVIEAKGTIDGVVQTPLKGSESNNWTHWLKCPFIEYIDQTAHYKKIIQEHCQFDNPEGIWQIINLHPYPKAWLQKWADSYKRN